MSRPGFVVLAGLVAVASIPACSNNTGPTAVILNVSLSTPSPNDGAVLLAISGGPVDSVEAVGYATYTAAATGTVRIIVAGDLVAGTIARIHLPDGRQATRYSATVEQVATRVTYAQRDPAGYRASLLP
jgi:hypothetical protein